MLFGERLLAIRKKRKISQDEIAKAIGKHAPLIGRYERNEVKPSIEVAVQIANYLKVSLDYLVGLSDLQLDTDLLDNLTTQQKLNEQDRNDIIKTLNALLRDAKTRSAYA
jgi:transcriptional regulator with XRE-family HTH domain